MQRARPDRIVLALAAAGLLACSGEASAPAAEGPQASVADGPHAVAVVTVAGLGEIRFELLPELAPETVAHFTELAAEGLYDGTTFHRVVPGFMIQGGDPLTRNADPRDDGKGGWDTRVVAEYTEFPHVRGVVSKVRSGGRDTGTQFFIVHEDSPHLDGDYVAFGRVVSGMEIVDAITGMEIDTYGRYGPPDRPYPDDARIERIRIEPPDAPPAPLADAGGRS